MDKQNTLRTLQIKKVSPGGKEKIKIIQDFIPLVVLYKPGITSGCCEKQKRL
jgi:hypothetical protein